MLADYQLVALMALQFQLEDERYQRTIPGQDYVILEQDDTYVRRARRLLQAAARAEATATIERAEVVG
jgi:hypothetical protein